MCLAVPAKIIEIDDRGEAHVDIAGVVRTANLLLVPEAAVGDYILLHAGYAIARVEEQEALETLELLEEMVDREVS